MASGDVLAFFVPEMNQPPTSAAATPDRRNARSVLDFDDTTNEGAIFLSVMPANYAGGGVTAAIGFTSAAAAASGNTRFGGAFELIDLGTTSADSDSFAADNDVTGVSVPGAIITATTIAWTNGADMDSVGAGDPFRFRLTGKTSAEVSPAAGDVEVHFILLTET